MSYRDLDAPCPFCDRSHLDEPAPYAGLRICRECHDGKNARRLLAQGIRVQSVEELALDNEGHQHEEAHAIGATDHALPLQVRFKREGLLGRRFKLDLQTGDSLFDDAIGVDGRGLELERLIALEPVRFAIMDLVADAQLAINDGVLTARALGLGVNQLRLAATAIVWGMRQVARETSCPPAAPGLLPTLGVLSGRQLIGLQIRGDRVDPRQLASLAGLRFLTLSHTQLASPDLSPLVALGLDALRLVRIDEVRALASLRSLTGLQTLVLQGCPVEDLAPLAGLRELRGLNVSDTRVRDLSPVLELPLEELVVGSTPVPGAQLDELRVRRPGIRIS